ncbi:hypothetical protein KW791_03215 [Candidatus Parcubacteria bacterium]|nr:hypothetical protein [Candidatus Parcubacteria bacterium]
MDDQSPKPTQPNQPSPQANIDTLVKELSKSPSSNPPVNAPRPPQPPSQPMRTPSAPAPMPPKPAPAQPSPAQNPASQIPKEYQSSIRSMTDDLAKLKAGQQPTGTNVPRKVEMPSIPTPVPAPAPKPAAPAAPNLPKPNIPSLSKPIPTPNIPSRSPSSVPPPVMSNPKPAEPNDLKSQFYVPDNAQGPHSSSRNAMYMIVAGVIVIFVGLYWFFVIHQPGGDVVESPLPTFTPRPTATPVTNLLESIFPDQAGSVVLPGTGDPTTLVNAAISSLAIAPGALSRVTITDNGTPPHSLGTAEILDRFLVAYPTSLKSVLGTNSVLVVYGQKESFDSKGKPVLDNPSFGKRLIIVTEVASSSIAAQQTLKSWESGMISGLGPLLGFDKTKGKGGFIDGNYQGVPIHFRNFPYPDHTIDYALITYQGKTYWIVTNSRESMYAAIDAFQVPGK